VFSPTTNKTGGFLGWEGLDPTGLSETVYEEHSGSTSTVNRGLANMPPQQNLWVSGGSGNLPRL